MRPMIDQCTADTDTRHFASLIVPTINLHFFVWYIFILIAVDLERKQQQQKSIANIYLINFVVLTTNKRNRMSNVNRWEKIK